MSIPPPIPSAATLFSRSCRGHFITVSSRRSRSTTRRLPIPTEPLKTRRIPTSLRNATSTSRSRTIRGHLRLTAFRKRSTPRRSAALSSASGNLTDYPDELMIDWGNTPVGSVAHLSWPQADASSVLALARKLYSTHQLSAADPNTIDCKVPYGYTYVPVPPGVGDDCTRGSSPSTFRRVLSSGRCLRSPCAASQLAVRR